MERRMLGGIFEVCCSVAFSVLFRLVIPLIRSFCFLRVSLLLHQIGRLYSHSRPRLRQASQRGLSSEHFFLLSRHVKQPITDQWRALPHLTAFVPERHLRCIFERLGRSSSLCDHHNICSGSRAQLPEAHVLVPHPCRSDAHFDQAIMEGESHTVKRPAW